MTKSTFDDAAKLMMNAIREGYLSNEPVTLLVSGCWVKGEFKDSNAQNEAEAKYADMTDGIQLFNVSIRFPDGHVITRPYIFVRLSTIQAIS